jgi:NitT/TauT family transport system substrate-binding protein
MRALQSRRGFVNTLSSACAAGVLGVARSAAAEALPEVTTIRLPKIPGICIAPSYVADELLRAEGFTNIRYLPAEAGVDNARMVARGELDFTMNFVAALVPPIDAGAAITVLAGVHPGCFELFAGEHVRSVTDLKGKSVGVQSLGSSQYLFLASIASYVGLEPAKDINWVTSATPKPTELFADGKIDAFLGFPPEPQDLRARKIGRVILNSALDRPWSQYFCCMLAGNTDFVRRNPVATKKVIRAVLKAADLCVAEPERAARRMVEGGFTARYEYALQTMGEIPYARWREYDPEDTIRFYALRLHEAGVVGADPKEIIARGTDWRLLDEVKRELKA